MKSGTWRINYRTENITPGSIKAYGSTKTRLSRTGNVTYNPATSPYDFRSRGCYLESTKTGQINVYRRSPISRKAQNNKQRRFLLGISMLHLDNVPTKSGNADFTIPDALDSGSYYTVVTFSNSEGISCAISDAPISFVNPRLPADVTDVRAEYVGNGNYHVIVTDAENYDYTHYMVEIADTDGTPLENNVNIFLPVIKHGNGKEAGARRRKKKL